MAYPCPAETNASLGQAVAAWGYGNRGCRAPDFDREGGLERRLPEIVDCNSSSSSETHQAPLHAYRSPGDLISDS